MLCNVSHSGSRVGGPGVELGEMHDDIQKIYQILPFASEVRGNNNNSNNNN